MIAGEPVREPQLEEMEGGVPGDSQGMRVRPRVGEEKTMEVSRT
jgi:hypothetical protein